MKHLAGLLCLLWLAPTLAAADPAPGGELSGTSVRWRGAETVTLATKANDVRGQPLALPFPNQAYGACRLTDAALVIRKDGTGEFLGVTTTTQAHANATWHTVVTIYSSENAPLFDTGDFAGPLMNDDKPNVRHVWKNSFVMDPATLAKVYKKIDHATLAYAC